MRIKMCNLFERLDVKHPERETVKTYIIHIDF